MSPQYLTATQTRTKLFELLDQVNKDPSFQPIISYRGRPAAVLINYQEWQELLETIDIAADPQLLSELKKASQDITAENLITYDDIFGHPQPGFGVADKADITYKINQASNNDPK
jgi:prevent-host-death family protein